MKIPILLILATIGVVAAETCAAPKKDKDDCMQVYCYDDNDPEKWYPKGKPYDCPKDKSKEEEYDDPEDEDCKWVVKWEKNKDECLKWKECDGRREGGKRVIDDKYCDKDESKDSSSEDCDYLESDSSDVEECNSEDSEDSCKDCCYDECKKQNSSSRCKNNCYSRCKRDADCYDLSSSDDSDDDRCEDDEDDCCDCCDKCVKKKSGRSKEKNCIRNQCKGKCKDAAEHCSGYKRSEWKHFFYKKCDRGFKW